MKLPDLSKNNERYAILNQRSDKRKLEKSGNYRYKYGSKANIDVYNSYLGKNSPNSKMLNKLKMYQNNTKDAKKKLSSKLLGKPLLEEDLTVDLHRSVQDPE